MNRHGFLIAGVINMDRILIIEDETDIALLEKDYLEVSGFRADLETDGEKGLKKALSEDYDLVILDLMIPGMSGFEVCRKIREQKDIPVIIISARKDDMDKIEGFGLGADDYMTKPFSPREMVARVKGHLERYRRLRGGVRPESHILQIRNLKIDSEARIVWVDGEEKNFTFKEFDLLLFLARHPNHVFSKEELFREIWGMEALGDSATVTVHINRIREKIEYDAGKPQFIETLWGVGYRFRV